MNLSNIKNNPQHILAKGFRSQRPGPDPQRTSSSGIEVYFPNTILNILRKDEWEILLSRIGKIN